MFRCLVDHPVLARKILKKMKFSIVFPPVRASTKFPGLYISNQCHMCDSILVCKSFFFCRLLSGLVLDCLLCKFDDFQSFVVVRLENMMFVQAPCSGYFKMCKFEAILMSLRAI